MSSTQSSVLNIGSNISSSISSKPRADKLSRWYIYLVQCHDNTLYCGISTDISKRVKIHNDQKGAKYTKSRVPVVLKWQSEAFSHSQALKLEYKIKKLPRKKKLMLIKGDLKINEFFSES